MIYDVNTHKIIGCYFREVKREEIIHNNYNPKGGWSFNWLKPITHSFEVYGLVTEDYPDLIQGLIALKSNYDEAFRCVDIDIIESAPQNKKVVKGEENNHRRYIGVGRCLVAFACEYSLSAGLEGFIELTSKSSKIDFYQDLGACSTYGQNMMITGDRAIELAKCYFSGGVQWWEK
ncbi:hypothetical protein GCM10011351_31610 [Paraliobacillus quinghaiensis]|uniref:Uncharacterized protein n=1 Tax=Paraliobacillus quinghaiensis TaxID=470815 RepID=A0A917TY25_9BACI|nr:hypothetical protein [Paraliobacillus quinghaiensis]GGM43319.1 hypothetical protein GCM10011351_31610 [Paraliobacillus quinghaiensis]